MKKLHYCKVCGKEVASSAKKCPHCGAKQKHGCLVTLVVLLLIIVAAVIGTVIGGDDEKREEGNPNLQIEEMEKALEELEKAQKNELEFSTSAEKEEQKDLNDSEDMKPSEESESKEKTETEEVEESKTDEPAVGVRPEFKEAMDSYEAFFEEYCEFMKAFEKNPSDLTLLSKYATFMASYTETMQDMEKIDDGTLSDAETLYYIEVTNRINQMLAEVAVDLSNE